MNYKSVSTVKKYQKQGFSLDFVMQIIVKYSFVKNVKIK